MKCKLVLALSSLFLFSFCLSASADLVSVEDKDELNKRIAMVNGVEIKKKDFKWALISEVLRLTSMSGYLKDEEMVELKNKTYERLINRELLYQESLKQGIEISPLAVETAYNRAKGSMLASVDKEGIRETLDMTETDIKDEFRRAYAAHQVVKNNVPIDRTASEEEINAYFKLHRSVFDVAGRVKVSHIVIEFPKTPNPAQKALARNTIEEVRVKLAKGEAFEELARRYSTSFSRVNGGNIGFLPKGRADRSFEDAAYALNPGQISDIVESSYGYHIIKVMEREPDTKAALSDIRENIVELVVEEKESLATRNYIAKLKANATIEIFFGPQEL